MMQSALSRTLSPVQRDLHGSGICLGLWGLQRCMGRRHSSQQGLMEWRSRGWPPEANLSARSSYLRDGGWVYWGTERQSCWSMSVHLRGLAGRSMRLVSCMEFTLSCMRLRAKDLDPWSSPASWEDKLPKNKNIHSLIQPQEFHQMIV